MMRKILQEELDPLGSFVTAKTAGASKRTRTLSIVALSSLMLSSVALNSCSMQSSSTAATPTSRNARAALLQVQKAEEFERSSQSAKSPRAIQLLKDAIAIREPQFNLVEYGKSRQAPFGVIPGTYTDLSEATMKDANQYVQDLELLAIHYRREQREDLAEPIYKKLVAINEKALGQDNEATAGSLVDLGWTYIRQGRYAEAEPVAQRAIAISEHDGLSDRYPQAMVMKLALLDNVYEASGEYAKAESIFKREISLLEHDKNLESADVGKNGQALLANVLHGYATLLHKMHREADAAVIDARAKELYKVTHTQPEPESAYK